MTCFHCFYDFSISIDDNGVLYSSTIIVWYSVQPVLLSITEVSFIILGIIVFGAKMFRIENFSWWIFPLMNMKCSSSSHLITFCWKSILLDRLKTPACFLGPFA